MKYEAENTLPEAEELLRVLADEIPPMPEGLHDRWMEQVEETPVKELNVPSVRVKEPVRLNKYVRIAGRALAVAAAAVFLIGGTIASRGLLHPSTTTAKQAVKAAGSYTVSNDSMPALYAESRSVSYSSEGSYAMEEPAEMAAYSMDDSSGSVVIVDESRKIIRTVNLSITAPDYAAAIENIRTACALAGGRITSLNERNTKNATIVLRVPAENLDSFLDGANGFGNVTRREESSEDVTDSYRDTQARLETQIALRTRYTALLEKATTVEEMLEIESKLADVQYYIDSLTGTQRYTDSRVAESTVTITLKEEQPKEEVINEEKTFLQRVAYAFSLGWEAFAELITDMSLFLVLILPFILLIAVVWFIIRRVRKARRQHREN